MAFEDQRRLKRHYRAENNAWLDALPVPRAE
jgi:hypothetical protein